MLDARWQGTWAAIVTNAIASVDPTQILADERALLAVAPLTAVGAVRAQGAVSAVRIGPTVVTLPVVGESARVVVLAEAAVVGRPLRFGGMPHTGRSAPCTPPDGVARLCCGLRRVGRGKARQPSVALEQWLMSVCAQPLHDDQLL